MPRYRLWDVKQGQWAEPELIFYRSRLGAQDARISLAQKRAGYEPKRHAHGLWPATDKERADFLRENDNLEIRDWE